MESERSLHQLSRAFRNGSFADRVLTALAKAAKERALSTEDECAMREATEFLQEASQGYSWVDTRRIDSDTLSCTRSFTTAARSLTDCPSTVSFQEDIEAIKETLENLLAKLDVAPDNINRSRRFFCRMLSVAMNDFDRVAFSAPSERADAWEDMAFSRI